MRIPPHDPVRARKVIESLASPSKLQILALISKRPSSPSEIAETLGLKLPTVMHHLSELRDAGLIRPASVRRTGGRGRPAREYALSDRSLTIEVDLTLYPNLPPEEEIWDMVSDYVRAKMESGGLPSAPGVGDVASTLGVDRRMGAVVLSLMKRRKADVISLVASRVLDVLRGSDRPLSIREVAERSGVDRYWAVLALERLQSDGLAEMFDGTARPT